MNIRVRHFMVGLLAGMLANGRSVSPLSAQTTRDLRSEPDSALVNSALTAPMAAGDSRVSMLTTREPVALRHGRARSDSTERGLPAPSPRASHGSNVALIGVGAAAVVVGLLVGGDAGAAVAIGGGVVGLIGLYRYLR
jgi:hypothetical protein